MISRCRDNCRTPAATIGQLSHGRQAVACRIRHRNVRLAERDPAVRGQAVMGHSAMPLTGVGSRDSQGADRTATRTAAALMASPALTLRIPSGAGAEISRPLAHDDELGTERESSSETECKLTASRSPPNAWPTVTVLQQAAGPQLRYRAGEREWQRALIAHHVDDPGAGPVVRDREQHEERWR